jgi:hypothetical protein
VLPSKIIAAAKNMPNLAVGNFEFVKEELSVKRKERKKFLFLMVFVSRLDQIGEIDLTLCCDLFLATISC